MEKAMGTPRIMERDSLPLPKYKKEKNLDIDLKSALLIEDGFEYQGKRYTTLSSIVNAITGSYRNGYSFFNTSWRRKQN